MFFFNHDKFLFFPPFVAYTGAGKTTIGRLLFRFYDVLGGSVKVNGVDVRSATQASLRGAMGVVPQTASLFNDTIRSNILYGRRDATEAELIQAAVDAQLYDFIQSLDEGWETMVGDRGLKLSGMYHMSLVTRRFLFLLDLDWSLIFCLSLFSFPRWQQVERSNELPLLAVS